MSNKIKHLEMVQDVIKRMASNSFTLKGWTVTLVSAIFALSKLDTDKSFALFVFVPIITFWLLDSYYLYQERLYRQLYKEVAAKTEDNIDFSLNADRDDFKKEKNNYPCTLFSTTEILFYIPLAALTALFLIIFA